MHKNSYQMVLTEDETHTMMLLAANGVWIFDHSPRKHCDAIYSKLKQLTGKTVCDLPEFNLMIGEVSFLRYPVTKTPQQLKIEELEATINEAQKQLEELKGI